MNHERVDRNAAVTPPLTAVEAALAAGDLPTALRAWQDTYGETLATWRWESLAEAGDAYLRIARASGSPADHIARARALYLSALLRASAGGSLDGMLRLASAFVELGDDETVAHALRIARRLTAAVGAPPVAREGLHVLPSPAAPHA